MFNAHPPVTLNCLKLLIPNTVSGAMQNSHLGNNAKGEKVCISLVQM